MSMRILASHFLAIAVFFAASFGQSFVNTFDDGNLQPYKRTTPCADKIGNCDCGDGISVKWSSERARSGSGSCYFRLKPCHEKADITMSYPGANKDNWIGFSAFFPKDMPADYGSVLWQLHDTNEGDQCPGLRSQGPLKFMVSGSNNKISIHMRTKRPGENCNEYTILSVDYNYSDMKGVWTDFVVNVKSSVEKNGYLRIWMGKAGTTLKKALDYSGVTFSYNGNGPAFRFGPYTGNPRETGSTWEIWMDEYRYGEGVGFDAVAPQKCDVTHAHFSGQPAAQQARGVLRAIITGSSVLHYSLPRAFNSLSVSLVNTAGKTVLQKAVGRQSPGNYRLSLLIAQKALPAGSYVVKFNENEKPVFFNACSIVR